MNAEMTVVCVGASVTAFVCGFAVCAWLVRRMYHEAKRDKREAREAVKSVFQACREVLNFKQFDRVRRRSLDISNKMYMERKGRGK